MLDRDERLGAAAFLTDYANLFPDGSDTKEEARELAAKLEAEPEPTWRQQDGGEVGGEPLCFTIGWDVGMGCYRVSVSEFSGPLQVVPSAAYDAVRGERDEAREALRELSTYAPAWDASGNPGLSAAQKKARAVLEGAERTHALVPLADLAGAVHLIGGLANLCQGAGDVSEARSHRTFADRLEAMGR